VFNNYCYYTLTVPVYSVYRISRIPQTNVLFIILQQILQTVVNNGGSSKGKTIE